MLDLNREIIVAGNKMLLVRDLKEAIEGMGIVKGDILCVHSQIFGFGKPLLSKEEFLDTVIQVFQEIVGYSGMLIMPTFSYSFCKKEVYDVRNSPSTVGVLTEYYRNMPEVKRTVHPIFSFALCGDRADVYLDIGPDAFSLDSIYGKMIRDKGKILMFGANKGYTFYYLAEEHINVKHRYFKNFEGQVKNAVGKTYTTQVPYMVRDLSMKSDLDEEKLAEFLIDNNLQKQIPFGKGTIGIFECGPVYEAVVKALQEDEQRFLTEVHVN